MVRVQTDAWAEFCPIIIIVSHGVWEAGNSNILLFENLGKIKICYRILNTVLPSKRNRKYNIIIYDDYRISLYLEHWADFDDLFFENGQF
jgi:hypothetical protein